MKKCRIKVRPFIFPVFAVLIWETLAHTGFLQGRWPTLLEVVSAAGGDWKSILGAAGRTGWQVCQAMLIGVIAGVPIGVLISESRCKLGGVYGSMAGMKAVPVTVLIPIFLTIFGLEKFIVPLVALPLILNFSVNTSQAIAQASRSRLRLLESWSVPYSAYVRHVLPFECLDSMLQTGRVMLPFAFALHIALDYFLCIPHGLGCYVYKAYTYNKHAEMYAAIIVVGGIGLLLGKGLDIGSRRLLGWKRDM